MKLLTFKTLLVIQYVAAVNPMLAVDEALNAGTKPTQAVTLLELIKQCPNADKPQQGIPSLCAIAIATYRAAQGKHTGVVAYSTVHAENKAAAMRDVYNTEELLKKALFLSQ